MTETGAPPPAGVPVFSPPRQNKNTLFKWIIVVAFIFFAFCFLFFMLFSLTVGEHGASMLGRKHIGVVEVDGMILDSKETIEKIRNFVDNDHIAAIIIRINSPGGGIAPSQEIYDEVMKARDKKKVVVSMAALAASGGYYIAAPAHVIVANPGTITGSIGVLMKFMDIQELQRWAKLKSFTLKSGRFKDMGSPTKDLSPEEQKIFQNMIDQMKEQFVEDIARGRNMAVEEVRKLADGRIFTGKEAKENGLVDEMGNLQDAIDLAAKMVGVHDKPKVVYPEEKRPRLLDYFLGTQAGSLLEQLLYLQNLHVPLFFYAIP